MTAPAKLHTQPATEEQAQAQGATDVHTPARGVAMFRVPAAPVLPDPPAVLPRPARPRPRHPARPVRPVRPLRSAGPVPPSGCDRVARGYPAVFPGDRLIHLVLAMAVTLLVVGALAWLGQAADTGVPVETAVVRVGAGETVWDVAERVAPESDARAVVERIRELNALTGSAVQPGQQLRVPDGR